MTHDEFVSLVRRLERDAARSPGAYRARVAAIGALAYAYVGGVVLIALGLLGGTIWAAAFGKGAAALVKVFAALVGFLYAVGRSMWVRLDPPQGLPLSRDGFPVLFDTIERVRATLRAPRPHEVLLVDDFNAAVVQHPRLGVLGWPCNTLILGLPYLQALSPEQAIAVIAHEFGHLAGSHGRTGAWIYRSRRSWSQLLERMEADDHWASFVFRPFFRWYAPYFNAYSFVLARAQEYEADRASVEITGARAAADALVRAHTAGRRFGERWDRIWRRAEELESPDVRPYSDLRASDLAPEPADAEQWLTAALQVQTDYDDTHPCLRERIAALGEVPRVPAPAAQSAAEALLGDGLAVLAEQLDRAWQDAVREKWMARHRHVAGRRALLSELAERARSGPLPRDDQYQYADLVEALCGDTDRALALHRAVLAQDLDHVSSNLAVGRLLLAREEEAGLGHLESAIAIHHSAILPASRVALPFLRAAGRVADAERWLARAHAHQADLDAAERERDRIPFNDAYVAHGLAPDAVEALSTQLAHHDDVRRAWLVRRRLASFDEERPQWVLGVERRTAIWDVDRRSKDRALQERLAQTRVRGDVRILVINQLGRSARRPFRSVPGCEIRLPSRRARRRAA